MMAKPITNFKENLAFAQDEIQYQIPQNVNDEILLLKEFTDEYKKYSQNEIEKREAACMRIQWRAMFCDIEEEDLFAGRSKFPIIGFSPQAPDNKTGYYYLKGEIKNRLNDPELSAENKKILQELKEFWKQENTVTKTKKAYPPEMQKLLPSDNYIGESGIAFTLWRMSGSQLDYGKIISLGIPGLKKEIQKKKNSQNRKLFDAMEEALEILSDVCLYYADRAAQQAQTAKGERENQLRELETTLRNISSSKPKTFREGLQLMFLYNTLSGSLNYGRMDDYLGDLYVKDIENKTMTEEQAIELMQSLWMIMVDRGARYDQRMILGGKGRNNEKNADRLALAIMETSRRVKDIVPQIALRFYEGQDPALYQKGLDILGEGYTFPMLYNDDINIPAAMKAFDVPYEEAIHVIQFGCGEYILNHRSFGTPSAVINLTQALLVTLHRGINPMTGKEMGMQGQAYQKYNNFATFEDLLQAYKDQVELYVDQLALHEELEYIYAGKDAPFLYFSMAYDDCLERGKAIFSGGIRHLGGTLESYGNSNTSDALVAIKELVYDKKVFTLDEMVKMLDCDFAGYEKEQKMMLNCPKYGNDIEIADEMLVKIDEHVCTYTRDQREKTGLDSYLIVIINNDANIYLGMNTTASPDGRNSKMYLNNGNSPMSGMDKNGVTAFLNSIVKPDVSLHAGAVQNMKFSKEMFSKYREKLEILLKTYWENGGAQAMLTVVGKEDLENAIREPEKYQHLIVRMGGFSERFVNLPPETQKELLARTIY